MSAKDRFESGDVEMPPDGTENEASVLDQAPPQPKQQKQGGVKVRRTKKGSVEVAFSGSPDGGYPNEAAPNERGGFDRSPADPEIEIQSMVDVESARPSLPKAIRGTLSIKREKVNFDVCEDGVTPAITGFCGHVADAPGFEDEILRSWGGGRYIYTGIDKKGNPKALYLDLGGYSKPIPNTPHADRYDQFPPIDENMGFGVTGAPMQQPSAVFQDEDGQFVAFDEPEEDLGGWVFSPARNQWVWKSHGRPPGPPPRHLMGGGSAQSFNLDHSVDGDERMSRLEWERERDREKREEEKERRAEEQRRKDEERQERRDEEQRRRDEERARREEEREERRAEENKRREEDNRRRDEDNKRRDQEREDRRRDEDRAREDRRAQIEAAKVAAEAQASAVKEAARLTADAQKEAARAQADSNKMMFEMFLKKSGDGGVKEVVGLGLQIAELAQGNAPEKSTASEVADAIKESAKPVFEAFRDSVLAIKGYPSAGQPLPGQPQPQQLGNAPQQPLPPPAEVQFQIASMQLVGFLVNAMRNGRKPSQPLLSAGCLAYEGLSHRVVEIENRLLLAQPEQIVGEYERGCTAIPHFAPTLPSVRDAVLSPAGRTWLQGLKDSIVAEKQKRVAQQPAQTQGQPPRQQAPAAPPAATDGHVPNPNDPRITQTDPTRPEIKQS